MSRTHKQKYYHNPARNLSFFHDDALPKHWAFGRCARVLLFRWWCREREGRSGMEWSGVEVLGVFVRERERERVNV